MQPRYGFAYLGELFLRLCKLCALVFYLLRGRFCKEALIVKLAAEELNVLFGSLFLFLFLLCGIFPLVPGAGVFWFTYYMVSSQFSLSSTTGFNALKAAIAIVLGIVFAMELPQRLFSGFKRFRMS